MTRDERIEEQNKIQKTRDDITTPQDCVEKMLSYLPNDFFKQQLKILDPCAGNGIFVNEISKRVQDNNKVMIIQNEIDDDRYLFLNQNFHENDIFHTKYDFLEKDYKDEKFDLIVANPPYSGGGNKNKSLSNLFIEKSIDLTNEEGYMCFITPNNWMTANNNNTTLKKLLENGQFVVIDNTAKKYFKGVGSSFVIWLWKKTKTPIETIVYNGFLTNRIEKVSLSSENKFIPLELSNSILKIFDKYLGKERNDFDYRCDLHNFTKKNELSDIQDEEFKFRTLHTMRKTRYSRIKQDFFEKEKIIVPLSTYFDPILEKDCNVTQSLGYLYNEKWDKEYIEELVDKIQNNKVFYVLIWVTRYGNFNNVRIMRFLKWIEKIELTKEEEEEINLLYSLIKYKNK